MKHIRSNILSTLRAIPVLGPVAARVKRAISGEKFEGSAKYWDGRYQDGGDSGAGSYGRLAQFKAEIINSIVVKNGYQSAIEYGCGDGSQLSLLSISRYIGVDVSPKIIEHCKKKFRDNDALSFYTIDELPDDCSSAEVVLSLDVIYHLVEDNVYVEYMERLFGAARACVIVYASNKEEVTADPHVRHRCFVDWVRRNQDGWELSEHIPNRFPFEWKNPRNTSFADFYIFQKKRE